MSMPEQKPGKSRQDYGTPDDFLDALELRFGELTWDCAADADNAVAGGDRFFSKDGESAFDADWRRFKRTDLLYMNPEFSGIAHLWAPLVAKWTTELPWLRLLMLTPAALGSEWYRKHVEDKAMVLPLNPRLTFVGEKDPYPKDLMLSCFGFGVTGVKQWRWAPTAAEKRAERKRLKLAAKRLQAA
jgi:hypothetical protein